MYMQASDNELYFFIQWCNITGSTVQIIEQNTLKFLSFCHVHERANTGLKAEKAYKLFTEDIRGLAEALMITPLKVHKREKFFGSDFEFFTIL